VFVFEYNYQVEHVLLINDPLIEIIFLNQYLKLLYLLHHDLLLMILEHFLYLLLYVEHHLMLAAQTATPLLQPMFFSFSDSECYDANAETQYMFGPEWLVAPVVEQGATERRLYLPSIGEKNVRRWKESRRALSDDNAGAISAEMVWKHHFSGVEYSGGQWVVIQTQLSDFPLFRLEINSTLLKDDRRDGGMRTNRPVDE